MNDEYTPEERNKDLAYKYQTLRCWILNEILGVYPGDFVAWSALRDRAKQVLKDTE